MELREIIENIVDDYLKQYNLNGLSNNYIPIGISNRHIHLSQKDLEILFGKDYQLNELKKLSQTEQYAAKETLKIVGPKGIIENVRILGPIREETQVEILQSDTYKLGIKAPVKLSGDLIDTPGITLIGPKNVIKINSGVIIAKRHVHMNTEDASKLGYKNFDTVNIKINTERPIIFHDIPIRIHNTFTTEFHIDMDEANAALIQKETKGIILRQEE